MIGRTVPGDFPVIFYLQHRCQRHFLQYTIGSVPLCTRKNNLTVPFTSGHSLSIQECCPTVFLSSHHHFPPIADIYALRGQTVQTAALKVVCCAIAPVAKYGIILNRLEANIFHPVLGGFVPI